MCKKPFVLCLFNIQDPIEELELKYLNSGPSLALGLLRVNAVKRLLELMGPEDPVEARTIDQTLWRAQYGSDRLHNGIYGQHSDKNNQILKKNNNLLTDIMCTFSYRISILSKGCRRHKTGISRGCVLQWNFSYETWEGIVTCVPSPKCMLLHWCYG